ncbi:MAG TPA: hypothetical protein ENH62_13310, partial [Marinobacter sp.]|nr:hypothetical protein [Marinobacter sp.]
MADESKNTGVVEQVPAAGEPSGVTPPVAGVEDQSQVPSAIKEPGDQQTPAGEPPKEIPYERFAEKVAEANASKAEVTELQQQLALVQATQQVYQQQQVQPGAS